VLLYTMGVTKVMPKNDLEFYDRSAAQWWEESAKIYALHHLNPPRFQFFSRYVPHWQGLRVLDVGCGGGFSCEYMARMGAIATGIDQSRPCIEAAQRHAQANGFAIDYQTGHAEALPYCDASFDAVVCVDVLEHVADVRQTLAELSRVLKPCGIFLFDTINRTRRSRMLMIWLLEHLLREIPQGIHDWHKFIQPQELTTWMGDVGLGQIEIQGFNLLGDSVMENWANYWHYQKKREFRVTISGNTSVMYIGKAIKLG